MSPADFDRVVSVYLDGEATRAQVLALRQTLRERPELKGRLAALVRLHRAQSAALVRPSRPSLALVLSQLRAAADRGGRALAHVCLLLLVCVELDVAVPRMDAHDWVNGGRPTPVLMPVAEVIGSEVMGTVMGTVMGEDAPPTEPLGGEAEPADAMAEGADAAMPESADGSEVSEA